MKNDGSIQHQELDVLSTIKGDAVKELVELIVKSLVDNPDKVKVTQLDGNRAQSLKCGGSGGYGKVIGKQGRNAQAIRIIVAAAGMKLKKRINVEILEKDNEGITKKGAIQWP